MYRVTHPCNIVCKLPAGASLSGVGAISWRVLDMVIMAIHLDIVMLYVPVIA